MWVDFHTHKVIPFGVVGVQNIDNPKGLLLSDRMETGSMYSIGLHPWDIVDNAWSITFDIIAQIAFNKSIKAIGECGFDKFKGDKTEQRTAFQKHIELSEKLKLPLIIHNVGGDNDVWFFHKKERPLQPWIIHSFIGNTQIAKEFAKRNIFCSFSPSSLQNPRTIEAFKHYPPHLTFLETDDTTTSSEVVYSLASSILERDIEILKDLYYNNFKTLFKLND